MKGKTILPADIRCHSDYQGRERLEAMGVQFIRLICNDQGIAYAYWEVRLPKRWKIVPVDGSSQGLWLLDDKNRHRAQIKINGDYCCMGLLTKYYMVYNHRTYTAEILDDSGQVLFSKSDERTACSQAIKWLDDHHSNWHDPAANWD